MNSNNIIVPSKESIGTSETELIDILMKRGNVWGNGFVETSIQHAIRDKRHRKQCHHYRPKSSSLEKRVDLIEDARN